MITHAMEYYSPLQPVYKDYSWHESRMLCTRTEKELCGLCDYIHRHTPLLKTQSISIQAICLYGQPENGRVYKGDGAYMIILHKCDYFTLLHEMAHIIRWQQPGGNHHGHGLAFQTEWENLIEKIPGYLNEHKTQLQN